MGLDMYLTRKKYIGANYEHRNVKGVVDISVGEKKVPIDFNKISYIEESAAYWRKANAIHNWFVKNAQDGVDDCREYWVSIEKLQELLDLCKEVKEKAILKDGKIKNGEVYKDGTWEPIMEDGRYIENAEEIAELLPTTSGCFFGSTEYDEWYMRDIEYTIKTLEELLEDESKLNEDKIYSEFYYQSSW